MRESWTDQRLDEFAADTSRRFDGVDARLDAMEQSMNDGFNRIDADMRELRTQTAAFQRALIQVSWGALATFFAGFIGVITQL